jgi:hypothetical protein
MFKGSLRYQVRLSNPVDAFIVLLLTLPENDASVIRNVCDDSLGGYTAIDSRKFAENFVKRRMLDSKGGTSECALDNIVSPKKDEWNTHSIKGKSMAGVLLATCAAYDDDGFTVVTNKRRNRKHKK